MPEPHKLHMRAYRKDRWNPSGHMPSWWSQQMEIFSALLALCECNPPVTGGFTSQRAVAGSYDVFFYLRLNKQTRRRWFETTSRSLWRPCNVLGLMDYLLFLMEIHMHMQIQLIAIPRCLINSVSIQVCFDALQQRHNGRDGVSTHKPHDCWLNRLFRRRSKKISKLRWLVDSPHKWPARRKLFPFDDVIMDGLYFGIENAMLYIS